MATGGGGELDDVVVDRVGNGEPVDVGDDHVELDGVGDRLEFVVSLRAGVLLEDRHLGVGVGVAQRETHRETVELDVGEREGALEVAGVLRRDHEERARHQPAGAVGGDLALLHHLEQGGLGLRAPAVDLVTDQDVREDRTLTKGELAAALVVHHDARDVGRQQVGRELDPFPPAGDRVRDRLGQAGLARPGHVVEQQVALGEQAAQGQADLVTLAADHLIDVVDQCVHDQRRVPCHEASVRR